MPASSESVSMTVLQGAALPIAAILGGTLNAVAGGDHHDPRGESGYGGASAARRVDPAVVRRMFSRVADSKSALLMSALVPRLGPLIPLLSCWA